MSPVAVLLIALKALRLNKLRSALTMLGIVIGVAAVITMIGVGSGAQQNMGEYIRNLGSNVIMVRPGFGNLGGVRQASGGGRNSLTDADARAIQAEVSEVQVAAAFVNGGGQVIAGNANWATQFYGVTPEYFEARDWYVDDGRPFETADMQGGAKVAILGRTVAHQLFGDVDPIGQQMRVGRVPVTVIGLLSAKGQSAFGQDQDDVVLLPLNTARSQVLGYSQARLNSVGTIQVKVRENASMQDAEDQIGVLLRQRHRLQPGQEDDFDLRNMTEILEAQQAAGRIFTYLLASVASVSLLVGGIGIMNIMLVSVTERTREIGLRMAVGARSRDILAQFMVEAITLSVLGGLFGIVVGLGLSTIAAHLGGWRVPIQPGAILLSVGFSGMIGVFFGFYPARRASRLQPIDALRYE